MIDRIWTRHLGVATVCFGGVGALFYAVMITVTLSNIAAVSGQLPFDMRPSGYSPQDATALLEALEWKGAGII